MVEATTRKVRNIIAALYQKKHIDEMTLKWLSSTLKVYLSSRIITDFKYRDFKYRGDWGSSVYLKYISKEKEEWL